MTSRLKTYLPIAVVAVLLVGAYIYANYWRDSGPGDGKTDAAAQATADAELRGTPRPDGTARATATGRPATTRTAQAASTAARHDLQPDEDAGGHTLSRHVDKTDDDLKTRLQREPDISAASTYTDRDAAEVSVAAALTKGKQQISTWEKGASKQNLVLRVTMPNTIGRSLKRSDKNVKAVKSAVVVLARSGGDWFVLTSYPEDR